MEENESTESVAEIQVTGEKESMGEPVLTIGTDDEFEILSSVTVMDLQMEDVQVRVLKPGVDRSRETFGEEDLTSVPYTTSLQKNKFMVVTGDTLELKSIDNLLDDKFVIMVTSQNGSKESKQLSFQIENKEYKDLRVFIYYNGKAAQPLYTKDEEEVKEQDGVNQVTPSENRIYILLLGDSEEDMDELFESAYYPSDYKINVTGGKVCFDFADIYKNGMTGAMVQKGKMLYFYFTSSKATITLTNRKGKKIAQYKVESTE